ncbi:hypothetical protein ACFY15_15525 [Streptomyces sp. NPDC001373]|uniref:hypothetical protein n=1 Tax=Streptomyces sp. NPDC001373 TaxID=3364565 RepID=UPI0036D0521F
MAALNMAAATRGGDVRGVARAAAEAALRRLGDLAVGAFPGTLLPNPLVREMSHLARQSDLSAPFTEKLAADIFMGTFSPKFLTAARIAADLLEDSLYARYYGIDCAAVRNMAVVQAADGLALTRPARTAPAFDRLCGERAGTDAARSWSPAGNGTVIEQAQVLTTHNLAVLVRRAGVAPEAGWEALAEEGFAAVCRLVARVHGLPRPLGTVKDAAYTWRQTLFFLSLCPPGRQAARPADGGGGRRAAVAHGGPPRAGDRRTAPGRGRRRLRRGRHGTGRPGPPLPGLDHDRPLDGLGRPLTGGGETGGPGMMRNRTWARGYDYENPLSTRDECVAAQRPDGPGSCPRQELAHEQVHREAGPPRGS